MLHYWWRYSQFCVTPLYLHNQWRHQWLNSSYHRYQRFDMQTRQKGQFCIVLTLKPHLCVALNKGIFDGGLNSNNSYWHNRKPWISLEQNKISQKEKRHFTKYSYIEKPLKWLIFQVMCTLNLSFYPIDLYHAMLKQKILHG